MVSAAVPFYGIPSPDWTANIEIPVQAHHGMEDNLEGFSDVATARALEERLKAQGAAVEFHYYDGVGHGFLNAVPAPFESWEQRTEVMGFPPSQEDIAEVAWSRTIR